jgi:DNA-directed RNA polymerase specialized sigma24 family protein
MISLTPDTPNADVVARVVSRYGRLFRLRSHDLEDYAQECWLGLLRTPAAPNYLACRDACVRAHRRALFWRERDALPPMRTVWADRPDEVLDVSYLLGLLTPRECQVVHLFYWHDMALKDIGDRLGVHWTTAATLKRDALAKLRTIYKQG